MNEELIQQYLRIHFKAISKQLKNGPGYRFSGQDRAYFKKLVAVDAHGTRRSTNPPSWEEVHIEPKQLYAVINEFFQLCFRAEQINPTYQEIGKWMHSLVCLLLPLDKRGGEFLRRMATLRHGRPSHCLSVQEHRMGKRYRRPIGWFRLQNPIPQRI